MYKADKVAVIGAGFMGGSIALLCAQNGLQTINIDVSEEQPVIVLLLVSLCHVPGPARPGGEKLEDEYLLIKRNFLGSVELS